MLRTLIILLLILSAFSTHSLDIAKACDELKEQKEALLSSLSTSYIEANLAGQCIGYRAVNSNRNVNISKACAEFIEQKENLLGNLSTSLKEANQAGICIGAIYGACGTINYTDAAQRVVYKISSNATKRQLRSVVGCNG